MEKNYSSEHPNIRNRTVDIVAYYLKYLYPTFSPYKGAPK